MSYDSVIIVGEDYGHPSPDEGHYVRVIATFDLAAMYAPPFANLLTESRDRQEDLPEFFCFSPIHGKLKDDDDSVLEVREDMYGGNLLYLGTVEDVAKVLEEVARKTDYRRAKAGAAMLRGFATDDYKHGHPWKDGHNLVVLHWAH